MADPGPAIRSAAERLARAFGASELDGTAFDELVAELLIGNVTADEPGPEGYRLTRFDGEILADLYLSDDGYGCVIAARPGKDPQALDAPLNAFVKQLDAYIRPTFLGATGVSRLHLSTLKEGQLSTLPDRPAQGISFSAQSVQVDDEVIEGLSFAPALEAGVAGSIPAAGRALRPWYGETERGDYIELTWPLAEGGKALTFGPVRIAPRPPRVRIPLAFDKVASVEEVIAVTLEAPGWESMGATLTADYMSGAIVVDIEGLPTLAEVLALVGTGRQDPALPPFLAELLSTRISDLWLALDPGESGLTAVAAVGLRVATDTPITIIQGALRIKPSLNLVIESPASAENRALSGTMAAEILIGAPDSPVTLTATASIPDFILSAKTEGLKLSHILEGLWPGQSFIDLRKSDFDCNLSVAADLQGQSGELLIELKEDHPAIGLPGKEGWHLHGLSLFAGMEGGDISVEASAELRVGEVSFDISGGYSGGWHLEAELNGSVNLTRLFTDVLGVGDHGLGSEFGDLSLSHLDLNADLAANSYSFSASASQDWMILEGLGLKPDVFSLKFSRLHLAIQEGALTEAEVTVDATLCGVFLTLDASFVPAAGERKAGWRLQGRTRRPVELLEIAEAVGVDVETIRAQIRSFSVEMVSLDIDTTKGRVDFAFSGAMEIGGEQVGAKVRLLVSNGEATRKTDFLVALRIGRHFVEGRFVGSGTDAMFVGSYHPDTPLVASLGDLGAALPGIKDYLPAASLKLRDILVAYSSGAEKSAFLLGATLDADLVIDGSALPIGNLLEGRSLGVRDLRLLAATDAFAKGAVDRVNNQLAEGMAKLPANALKDGGLPAGASVSAMFDFGGDEGLPLLLGGSDDSGRGGPDAAAKGQGRDRQEPRHDTGPPPSDGAKHMRLDKKIGPLELDAIGYRLADKEIELSIDGAVELGGVRLGLSGFTLSMATDWLAQKTAPPPPKVRLDGLELGYSGPGEVSLSGGFLRRGPDDSSYEGAATLTAPGLAIAGFGAYTVLQGEPSIFIFASLKAELGGPPFFRVKGLAGGFGFNRRLRLPPITSVQDFPLVRATLDPGHVTGGSGPAQVSAALASLEEYIEPAAGEYWLAAGLHFDSCNLVDAAALVSVQFGRTLEIGLLGLADLRIPRGAPESTQIARVEMALRASYRPSDGLIAIEGLLTDNSWVLSRDCRLRGGFAFYMWTDHEHAGDFVVSLGGYAPNYPRPSHYPMVPRIGVDWKVNRDLHITAEMYFAVTPSCMMAGGLLHAVYASGRVSASFLVQVDFCLDWQPLRYSGSARLAIHVHVDLDLFAVNVDLNVLLEFWGPEFSGRIIANLDVIQVTIALGEQTRPAASAAMKFDEFRQACLPPDAEVLSLSFLAGLRRSAEADANIVAAEAMVISLRSAIPFTTLNETLVEGSVGKLGIPAMHLEFLSSVLAFDLRRNSDKERILLSAAPELSGVPAALWESRRDFSAPQAPSAAPPIKHALGVRLRLSPPKDAAPAFDVDLAAEVERRAIPIKRLDRSVVDRGATTSKLDPADLIDALAGYWGDDRLQGAGLMSEQDLAGLRARPPEGRLGYATEEAIA